MRTIQHDRARHDHLRRIQASRQSDVDVRPVPVGRIGGRFIFSNEPGEPHRTLDKVDQIASRARKV